MNCPLCFTPLRTLTALQSYCPNPNCNPPAFDLDNPLVLEPKVPQSSGGTE